MKIFRKIFPHNTFFFSIYKKKNNWLRTIADSPPPRLRTWLQLLGFVDAFPYRYTVNTVFRQEILSRHVYFGRYVFILVDKPGILEKLRTGSVETVNFIRAFCDKAASKAVRSHVYKLCIRSLKLLLHGFYLIYSYVAVTVYQRFSDTNNWPMNYWRFVLQELYSFDRISMYRYSNKVKILSN